MFCSWFTVLLGDVGFLAEDRRINVAVTRARRQLTVVCDSLTVRNHDFLKSLVDYMNEHGEIRTAFEYLEDVVPQNYTRDPKEGSRQPPSAQQRSKGESGKGKEAKRESGKRPETGGKSKGRDPQGKTPESGPFRGSALPRGEDQNQDQAQTQKKQDQIRQQIQTFLQDPGQTELRFAPSLNSHDRLLVHQISEELGLKHESQGEGQNRHITVSRSSSGPQEPSTGGEQKAEPQPSRAETEAETTPGHQGAAPAGVDLKSLHLERMRREQQKREERARLSQQQQRGGAAVCAAGGKSQPGKKGKGAAKGENSDVCVCICV